MGSGKQQYCREGEHIGGEGTCWVEGRGGKGNERVRGREASHTSRSRNATTGGPVAASSFLAKASRDGGRIDSFSLSSTAAVTASRSRRAPVALRVHPALLCQLQVNSRADDGATGGALAPSVVAT